MDIRKIETSKLLEFLNRSSRNSNDPKSDQYELVLAEVESRSSLIAMPYKLVNKIAVL